jgi:hypothetical protein
MSDYVAEFVNQVNVIYHYSQKHLKVLSDRVKECCDHLANSTGLVVPPDLGQRKFTYA